MWLVDRGCWPCWSLATSRSARQAALDYVLRRAVDGGRGPSDDRRRRGLAAVDGAHRAHRVARRRGRRRGARHRAGLESRSTSCRAGSSCRGSAPSVCRSTFKKAQQFAGRAAGDARAAARGRRAQHRRRAARMADRRRQRLRDRHHVRLRRRRQDRTRCARCASSPTTARSTGSAEMAAVAPFALARRADVRRRRRVSRRPRESRGRRHARAHRRRRGGRVARCERHGQGDPHAVRAGVARVRRHRRARRRSRAVRGRAAGDHVDADAVGAADGGRLRRNAVGAQSGSGRARRRTRSGRGADVAFRVGRQGPRARRCRRADRRQRPGDRQASRCRSRGGPVTARAHARQHRSRAHSIDADRHAPVGHARCRRSRSKSRSCAPICGRPTWRSRSPRPIVGRHIDVEQLRARAGGGEIAGSGTFDLDGSAPFTVTARATRFNPARFVDMPAAQLDGTVTARGTLSPTWDVVADVALATGSRFAGLAVAGTARAHATPTTAKDVAVDLHLGAASITLTGGFGTAADTLAYAVDVPRMQELRPLLARYAKAALPDPVAGALRARGTVTGDPRSPGFAVNAHGEALQWGPSVRVATLELTASAAPGVGREGRVALEARPITLAVSATGVTAPQGVLGDDAGERRPERSAKHTGDLRRDRRRHRSRGGVRGRSCRCANVRTARSTSRGSARSIRSSTAAPMRCGSRRPRALEIARDRVHVGATRLAVADGRADLANLAIDDGRIATHGSFTGIPVTALARLSGTTLPFPSTLVLGGDWSLAATPRLSGTLNVRRESGDWFATESATLDPSDLALGISELELSVRAVDDAFTASARFRSARAGTADATATLAAGSVAGRIATDAPITAHVHRRSRVAAAAAAVGRHAGRHGRARARRRHGARNARAAFARGNADGRRAALRPAAVRRAPEGRPLARAARRPRAGARRILARGRQGPLHRERDARAGRRPGFGRRSARRVSSGRRKTSPSSTGPTCFSSATARARSRSKDSKLALAGSINIDQGPRRLRADQRGHALRRRRHRRPAAQGRRRRWRARSAAGARSRSHARTRLPLHRRRPRNAARRPRARHDDCRPARSTPRARSARSRAPTTCSASGSSSTAAG